MAGFPGILTRLLLGPAVYRNRGRIRNPETALDAAAINLAFWQLAGINGLTARGWLLCSVSGSTISLVSKWLAWDPNGTLLNSEVNLGRSSAGAYTWDFDSASYPDKDGTATPLAIRFADARAGAAGRTMIGTVNPDGKSGTMLGYQITDGAAADVSSFLLLLY